MRVCARACVQYFTRFLWRIICMSISRSKCSGPLNRFLFVWEKYGNFFYLKSLNFSGRSNSLKLIQLVKWKISEEEKKITRRRKLDLLKVSFYSVTYNLICCDLIYTLAQFKCQKTKFTFFRLLSTLKKFICTDKKFVNHRNLNIIDRILSNNICMIYGNKVADLHTPINF